MLAAGPGAVLSHRSAAALWGLRKGSAIEVTSERHCRRPGITAYRNAFRSDEVTVRDGIPTTTVARTLLDLAAVLPPIRVTWRHLHRDPELRADLQRLLSAPAAR